LAQGDRDREPPAPGEVGGGTTPGVPGLPASVQHQHRRIALVPVEVGGQLEPRPGQLHGPCVHHPNLWPSTCLPLTVPSAVPNRQVEDPLDLSACNRSTRGYGQTERKGGSVRGSRG